jgi:hypothetical protein
MCSGVLRLNKAVAQNVKILRHENSSDANLFYAVFSCSGKSVFVRTSAGHTSGRGRGRGDRAVTPQSAIVPTGRFEVSGVVRSYRRITISRSSSTAVAGNFEHIQIIDDKPVSGSQEFYVLLAYKSMGDIRSSRIEKPNA